MFPEEGDASADFTLSDTETTYIAARVDQRDALSGEMLQLAKEIEAKRAALRDVRRQNKTLVIRSRPRPSRPLARDHPDQHLERPPPPPRAPRLRQHQRPMSTRPSTGTTPTSSLKPHCSQTDLKLISTFGSGSSTRTARP